MNIDNVFHVTIIGQYSKSYVGDVLHIHVAGKRRFNQQEN